MLKVLDLFSGIGGFSLGLERTGGFETVAFCEIDPFCQKVLKKHWPSVPIYNDVRNLDYDGAVDVITGGYPCQPFSSAGKRKGKNDDRHLWPSMLEIIKQKKPTWVIGENVIGHVTLGLDDVLDDLENSGYSTQTFIIPACSVFAPHRRYRTWIVANAKDREKPWATERWLRREPNGKNINDGAKGYATEYKEQINEGGIFWQYPTPRICRVDDGLPNRMDRTSSLGNAVVPQIPEMIGYAILEAEKETP